MPRAHDGICNFRRLYRGPNIVHPDDVRAPKDDGRSRGQRAVQSLIRRGIGAVGAQRAADE